MKTNKNTTGGKMKKIVVKDLTYTIDKIKRRQIHYRLNKTGTVIASIYATPSQKIYRVYHLGKSNTFKTLQEAKEALRKGLKNYSKRILNLAENI